MISQLADRILEILLALAGLLLTLRSLQIQTRSHKLDGLLKIIEAYRKEWDRQQSLIETQRQHIQELEKRVLEARHHEAVWKQRLKEPPTNNNKGANEHER